MRSALVLCLFLAPLAAYAQGTVGQRVACTEDAFKFCGAQIPDVPAITACMKTNYASLSPKCQAQFDRPAGKRNRGG